MSSAEPASFPNRVLLTTVGLNPQILTETLYALCITQDPPFVPTEIHVITTAEGSNRVRLTLLDPSMAQLAAFAAEFDLPKVTNTLRPEHIHVIRHRGGPPLADISSDTDSAAAADTITDVVRDLTCDETSALHVSIAGGRKTMGFLLGATLSLFGRAQDRMSHVLVAAPFEQHPEFYFPPRKARTLFTRDKPPRPISTADACILLADIPFVRLRHGLPQQLITGQWSYSETVARVQESVASPSLIVDWTRRRISCNGVIIELQPLPFALYAMLAVRRLNGVDGDGAIHWTQPIGQELVAEYAQLSGLEVGAVSDLRSRIADGRVPKETIEQNKSRVNRSLKSALGPAAEVYLIAARGMISGTRYEKIGLALPPEAIQFGPALPDLADEPD